MKKQLNQSFVEVNFLLFFVNYLEWGFYFCFRYIYISFNEARFCKKTSLKDLLTVWSLSSFSWYRVVFVILFIMSANPVLVLSMVLPQFKLIILGSCCIFNWFNPCCLWAPYFILFLMSENFNKKWTGSPTCIFYFQLVLIVVWKSMLFAYISLNVKLNMHFHFSRPKWLLQRGSLTRIPILIGIEFKKVDKKLNHFLDLVIQDWSILETGNGSFVCLGQYCRFLFLAPAALLGGKKFGGGHQCSRFNFILTDIPIKKYSFLLCSFNFLQLLLGINHANCVLNKVFLFTVSFFYLSINNPLLLGL